MAKKIIITILVLSFSLLILLSIRQEQINTVHAMTQLHRKIDTSNEQLNSLQIQIEIACSPSALQTNFALVNDLNEQN
jgi:cell division protein FtsL